MAREYSARQGVNSETLGNSELPSGRLKPKVSRPSAPNLAISCPFFVFFFLAPTFHKLVAILTFATTLTHIPTYY